MTEVGPDGPCPARIMIVGEAPGADEVIKGKPFVGESGRCLDKMLGEAGISRGECFVTNVCRSRPPGNDISAYFAQSKKQAEESKLIFTHQIRDKYVTPQIAAGIAQLYQELSMVRPNIVVACGNVPMWALTGLWGITKFRGSMLFLAGLGRVGNTQPIENAIKVIPTYHPAAILRQWDWRAVAVNDLKRAAMYRDGRPYPNPGWRFRINLDFNYTMAVLAYLRDMLASGPLRLSFDLETKRGHIDCAGIAWTLQDSICIPFMNHEKPDGHHWSADQEAFIIWSIYKILTHPNAEVVGQNLLYDSQYTYRRWHFIPRVTQDTMISWHVAFAGLPKKLDFQASMLNSYYKQWKPDKSVYKEGG